jgi:PhzF family phenazine biosynthesis protein
MKYFVVDAFTDSLFGGNPAGVCILDSELDSAVMQSIAAENNLSETAFIVKRDGSYSLRWFTPQVEVDLCGHATLGSAFVVMNFYETSANEVCFATKSGALSVSRNDDLYELDFPARQAYSTQVTDEMIVAVGAGVLEAYTFNDSKDLLLLLANEAEVKNLNPDFNLLKALTNHAVIVTAKGDDADFVSRCFVPNFGIDEDPVTGSVHTALIPFWSERLNKTELIASQLSKRGGQLFCKNCGERVKIAGRAVLYLRGEIFVDQGSQVI